MDGDNADLAGVNRGVIRRIGTARPLFDVLRAQLCFLHEPWDFFAFARRKWRSASGGVRLREISIDELMASGSTRHCREQPNLGDFGWKRAAITVFNGPAARPAIACKAAF